MTGLDALPAALRAKLQVRDELPAGWAYVNPQPMEDGAWLVDLVTATGEAAGWLLLFPDTEELDR